MNGAFTVSCIQFTSARDYEPNIRVVSDLVRRARDGGADFIMTPENTGLTEPVGKLRREKARDEANHPVLAALREVARETGVWLLIGSLAVDLSREPGRRKANGGSPTAPTSSIPAALSWPATTRSTCSMSISPAARATGKATPSARAGARWWPRRRGGSSG